MEIQIKDTVYTFNDEILLKQMRLIEPFLKKQQKNEIWDIDFMVEVAKILLVDWDKVELENKINEMKFEEFIEFSQKFEEILNKFSAAANKKK